MRQKESIAGWGNYPRIKAEVYDVQDIDELKEYIASYNAFIPFGNARSYGDSALNEQILNTKRHNHFLGFDSHYGILHCQSGVLFSEILELFVPKGWFLPVTPGTKFITVGGAIASDVHGKNHHIAGAFSDWIIDFKLLIPDGSILTCSKQENVNLFQATCGGMGLTGIILEARIQMKAIESSSIEQLTIKTNNLKETFAAFETYKNYTYSVAWIDCLAKGQHLGRSLLMVGEHASDGNLSYKNTPIFTVPTQFPNFALNYYSVKAFNFLYYAKSANGVSKQRSTIANFFYPLDVANNWNRIYGKNGFLQYQFVLPIIASYQGLERMLNRIALAGKGSFLAVLKLFGKSNDNWLSFPIEGYTLALDFKIESGLFELLDALDEIVLEYGGRIYLSKDARVARKTFEKGYQKIEAFRALRRKYKMNEMFQSLQSRRLGL